MIDLNQLRSAYVRLPPPARRILGPLLSFVPLRYRFGKTYDSYRQSIKRSRHDASFTSQWQLSRLRELIRVASEKSPYYKRLFQKTGLRSESIASFAISDLRKLPILTKDEVRQYRHDLLTCSADKLDIISTSGSTGIPLSFFLDRARSAIEWAFVQDSWSRISYEPHHRRAVFRGIHFNQVDQKPWEFDYALGELRLSPFHMTPSHMNEYIFLIKKYKIFFLHGYPSALSIFSNHVKRIECTDVANQIKGVMTISENIHCHQRSLISQAFPFARITSFYGMSEKVLFATEVVDVPDTFEMEPLYGICEIVDDAGELILEPGQAGRLIGTGLLFHGMPFIRYDTGDIAQLVDLPSHDNIFRMKVKNIRSRWGQEFLVGTHGELISMTAINIHSPAYESISAFQFQQHIPGKAILKVVPENGCSLDDIRPFLDEISAKIGSSMTFEFKLADRLDQNVRGKTKFIDQKIDLKTYQ